MGEDTRPKALLARAPLAVVRRLCSHICDPKHFFHWLLMRLRSRGQMLDPRHSLHSLMRSRSFRMNDCEAKLTSCLTRYSARMDSAPIRGIKSAVQGLSSRSSWSKLFCMSSGDDEASEQESAELESDMGSLPPRKLSPLGYRLPDAMLGL